MSYLRKLTKAAASALEVPSLTASSRDQFPVLTLDRLASIEQTQVERCQLAASHSLCMLTRAGLLLGQGLLLTGT